MQDIHAWRRPTQPVGVAASSKESGALATEVFYKSRRLGPEERLPDGFRDAGGSQDPYDGPSTVTAAATLLVDRSVDRRLFDVVESASKRLGKGSDPPTRVMAAALLVSDLLGRSGGDIATLERQCEMLVLECLTAEGSAVMLGDLLTKQRGEGRQQGAGGARYRAVLMKAFADWLDLAPCALCRDSAGCTWNTVMLSGTNYVVDVMLDPGAMYEEDSARAQDYLATLKQQRPSKSGAPSVPESTTGKMARPPWHVEPWEVEFDKADRAGRGGFGEVFCGTWAGQQVAVKEVRDATPTDGDVCDFVLEISLLSGLSHPNIVRFWRGCVDLRRGSRTLLMVIEWMDRGVLSDLLHGDTPGPQLSEGQGLVVALGIARGISYLHQVGVLHLDLKSPNVLLNSRFQVKLCDFGLAKVRDNVGEQTTLRGVSPVWAPPEMFDDTIGAISEKADVYSYGIIIFEIFARQVPFSEVGQMHLTRIKAKGQLPTFPQDLPSDLVDFSRSCLSHKPQDRISLARAVKQIATLGKQRSLDLQKVKDQMEAQGLNSSGSKGSKSNLRQQAEAEAKKVEAEIARLKKLVQEEEASMKAIEGKIKEESFDGISNAAGKRKLDEFVRANHEELGDMKFRCKLCMKLFRGQEFVERHIREKHFSDMLMGMNAPLSSPKSSSPQGQTPATSKPKKDNSDKFFDTDVADEPNMKKYTAQMSAKKPVDGIQDAARTGDLSKLQQCLRQGGDALKSSDPEGNTLLHLGAMGGHSDVVQYLLVNSADATAKNDGGMVPIHLAAQDGFLEVCQTLLSGNASCDAQDDLKMRAPLHFAASNGHIDSCNVLLQHKASPDLRDSDGGSPLHHAARSGSCELCELILSWGASVNGKDNDGWRPLHEAVRWGDGELVNVLLQRGADLQAASNEGETPLHVVPGGYAEAEVVEVLLARKANLNSSDSGGETPLHVAVKLGDEHFVSLMLNNGADANCKTRSGSTPLDLAKKDEIRWLLRSHKAKKGAAT